MKYIILILFAFNCFAQSPLLTLMGDDNFVYALDMNGSDESLSKTSASSLGIQSTAMTVLAWIKTDTDGALRPIIAKANGVASGSFGWAISVHNTANAIYAYWMDGTRSIQTSTFDVSDGVWHLVAVKWQPADADTTAMIYVDGSLKAQNLYTKDADIDAVTTLSIGTLAGSFFSDYLGEVQVITGRVLSAAEITEAYNLGKSGKNFNSTYSGATVRAWYKWDNNLLQDYSGTGNNLTGSNVDATDQVKVGTKYK